MNDKGILTALVVEDDEASREALCLWVERNGFQPRAAPDLKSAERLAETEAFDVALLDLELPDGNGLQLLPKLETQRAVDVVFLTGHSSVDSAVEAFRSGAVDYLTKPIDLKRLAELLDRTKRTAELRGELDNLRQELRGLGRFGKLIGSSKPMQQVYDLIGKVAPTDATVLITGETGTGKEVVAQAVHSLSKRARAAFVPLNCGAVAPTLIESELFGHERGSFTGAERGHRGVFERANGGTLFLDEITEMPIELQVKLLRTLEMRTVRRIGGDGEIEIDVRVIAATNRDPRKAVADGKLREDLLYRLLVFPIALPPLRERRADVRLLAERFVDMLNIANQTAKRLTAAALELLEEQAWPGNVRELKHVIERAYILARDQIGTACFQTEEAPAALDAQPVAVGSTVAEMEKRLILATLAHLGGDKKRSAEVLGISLKTLYNRLSEYKAEGIAGADASWPASPAPEAAGSAPPPAPGTRSLTRDYS